MANQQTMSISLGQRMEQRLAPRLIQSMEILQMSAQQLEARIEQELASNPTLELREVGPDEAELQQQREQEVRDNQEGERALVVKDDAEDPGHKDDFERLSNLTEEYGETWETNTFETGESYHPWRDNGERDAKIDAMANTAARQESLPDQLMDQWRLVECSPTVRKAGEYLIGFIDTDGYLRTDWATLMDQRPADVNESAMGEALALMQRTFEPPGLAARDLRECLLLQIDARKIQDPEADLDVARLLVDKHLKDIEQNRIPQISRNTNLSIDEIKEAIHHLRQFQPHPGRLLVEDSPRVITPDAVVEYDESQDRYVARLTRGRMPNLHVNNHYLKMQRDRRFDTKTREFVGTNIRSARWLMEAIEQRASTLLRVINVVVEAQRDFFDQGPQALKPLPMTTVADQLGIHVATVSRTVSEKYIQTPRGIFPLRMFFSGGTETEAGDAMSWAAIQAKLEQIINEEDKANPLSDDELVEKLKGTGIDIARRTVAKYRKQLNIAPARQRKQF